MYIINENRLFFKVENFKKKWKTNKETNKIASKYYGRKTAFFVYKLTKYQQKRSEKTPFFIDKKRKKDYTSIKSAQKISFLGLFVRKRRIKKWQK